MTDQVLLFLNAQYNLIDNNYVTLFRQCVTPDQQQLLSTEHQQALANLLDAENRVFDSNADLIQGLLNAGDAINNSIEASIQANANIVSILTSITAAVRIGASIVTLGVAG